MRCCLYITGPGEENLTRSAANVKNGDKTIFERQPLEDIARDKQLNAFKHNGFWKPMDTLREKNELTDLWYSGKAPWNVWDK